MSDELHWVAVIPCKEKNLCLAPRSDGIFQSALSAFNRVASPRVICPTSFPIVQRISENQLVGSTWTPSFYGYDGHGNVRFLANTGGTVTDTYTYDAFGMPIAPTGTTANNFRYSGEWLDPNLSFYNLRARYYNALTGRFETMDPYAGKITDPVTLHKYVYAKNNPVNLIDPTGRDEIEEVTLFSTEIESGATEGARALGDCIGGGLVTLLGFLDENGYQNPLTYGGLFYAYRGCAAVQGVGAF